MKPFEIISKDDFYAIKNSSSVVAIIVYTLDEEGLLDKIGVVTESNPHFQSGTYTGLVMGKVEYEDSSLLQRAKIETREESGYDVSEAERWDFIGELYTSKIFPEPIYCYSVNVTDLEQGEIKGDGSVQESTIKFNLIDLSSAKLINDSVLQSCFFKLFTELYKEDLTNYGTTK
jgi:8-oxo-dGTP pyrophosphatase MutT (NUDIX family)